MEHQILDDFENENPNSPSPLFLHRINLTVGVLIILIGSFLIYNCYYWYDMAADTFIPSSYFPSNYELLVWLSYGAMLLNGGFRVIRKEELGIEIIHVFAIALITYSIIILCFEENFVEKRVLANFSSILSNLILASLLLAYSYWKKLPLLYLRLSLSSYLILIGIVVGIIPFIFFWKELVS